MHEAKLLHNKTKVAKMLEFTKLVTDTFVNFGIFFQLHNPLPPFFSGKNIFCKLFEVAIFFLA